jgi:hypothetical protein
MTKNQDILTSELYNEHCTPVILKSEDDYVNIVTNYHFDSPEINPNFQRDLGNANGLKLQNLQININSISNNSNNNSKIYPLKLPFTGIVIKFIDLFKQYIENVNKFISPLYSEPASKVESISNEFIKKLIECFISFSVFSESELPILLCASLCTNIKYCYYSRIYLKEYLTQLLCPKFQIIIDCDKSFEEAWISYEELIYEKLKKKLFQFISDLVGREADLTELRKESDGSDIEILISYLQVSKFY